ncbi:MAG: hypothetical protein R3D28_24370 [Geminicoccaceae bacterium]
MRMLRLGASLLFLLIAIAIGSSGPARAAQWLGAYDYPFVDPLVATVVQTPQANSLELPELVRFQNVDIYTVRGLVERPVPPVYFFQRFGMEFGLVQQPGPAPLVFVIAGTGGGFNADINQSLARILYAAGFHVIGLPNPTHPNFTVNASTTGVPGRLKDDAVDLYRAMQAAYEMVRDRIEVTSVNLTGYSLGATYSAFVAELDSREKVFNFDRVLLLNPAVSVFASVGLVDGMLLTNTPEERNNVRDFINTVLAAFGRLYRGGEPVDFSGDFIYRTYTELDLSANEIEKLIGVAFRMSANTMAFTSDVLAGTGVIVPKGTTLTSITPLEPYYLRSQEFSFTRYFEDIYTPYFAAAVPGLTAEQMIADADLAAIEPYLAGAANVGVITNADDLILRPQDFAFLERVFADRLVIYPIGGHCGNYRQRDVAARIQSYFRAAELGQ